MKFAIVSLVEYENGIAAFASDRDSLERAFPWHGRVIRASLVDATAPCWLAHVEGESDEPIVGTSSSAMQAPRWWNAIRLMNGDKR